LNLVLGYMDVTSHTDLYRNAFLAFEGFSDNPNPDAVLESIECLDL